MLGKGPSARLVLGLGGTCSSRGRKKAKNSMEWKKEGREKKDTKRRSKALSRQKEKIDDSTRKGKMEIVYTV